MHFHKCGKCARIWLHGDENANDQAAHTCPCGEVTWERHPPLAVREELATRAVAAVDAWLEEHHGGQSPF